MGNTDDLCQVTTTTTTTTTTTPAPGINQCLCCNSGAKGAWQSPNCPCNGTINGWALDSTNDCSGPCISWQKTNGEVMRDCSDVLPPDYPIYTELCHEING